MGFIHVQYFQTYQKHLMLLPMIFYFKTAVLLWNKRDPFAVVFQLSSKSKAAFY